MLPSDLRMYPNPAATSVQVQLSGRFDAQVFDMQGRNTGIQSSGAENIQLETGSLARGLYLVRIVRNTEVYALPLMLK
jgi:hypothetical protein